MGFRTIVKFCCTEGYLLSGDYLRVDNAGVHLAMDSYEVIKEVLNAAQVRLVKLPTYSPELNPCELCFFKLKGYLRRYRSNGTLRMEVIEALGQITRDNLKHCIHPRVILSDFFLD
eukprot:TRINITY_DN7210_c0_g4_i3.p1 TRINITY_DN7210_c0_g4~~TRINITY_DN7210_c0_g4_i3.p1  ORF type:complete len:116 (+),score=11.05 TRINITY_DN7210_c0_g4_i3:306-653(+)